VPNKPLKTTDLTIVDAQGRPRLRLSATSKSPKLQMLAENGSVALQVLLDESNHPAITLLNPDGGSTVSMAVDPKGAHVKLDRPGGASSYIFLNDEGGSGVVLVDKNGKRRYYWSILTLPLRQGGSTMRETRFLSRENLDTLCANGAGTPLACDTSFRFPGACIGQC
jgi:hypothetical protein